MLAVTNAALEKLHESLAAAPDGDDSERCFRMTPRDEANLTLSYAVPATSDTTYKFNGHTVLAVPMELEKFCAGRSLDINDDGELEIA